MSCKSYDSNLPPHIFKKVQQLCHASMDQAMAMARLHVIQKEQRLTPQQAASLIVILRKELYDLLCKALDEKWESAQVSKAVCELGRAAADKVMQS